MRTRQNKPIARVDGILRQRTFQDLVVVDEMTDSAHCLNETAAIVFEHADGTRTVDDLADVLREKLDPTADTDLVELALDNLAMASLLEDRAPRESDIKRESRRRFVQKIGMLGTLSVLLPVVESIAAPTDSDHRSPTRQTTHTHTRNCKWDGHRRRRRRRPRWPRRK